MAIAGAWRSSVLGTAEPPANANVWGTGINPVHARGTGARNHTPGYPPGDGDVPPNLTSNEDLYDYTAEHSALFGYGYETGTADRPRLGDDTRRARSVMPVDFPEPGHHERGLPGGLKLRSQEHGGILAVLRRARFPRPTIEGFINKESGAINQSVTPSDRQYKIQAGEVQNANHRSGSQRGPGSQSDYAGVIEPRTRGMKVQEYAGGERHEDMRPRQQSPGRMRPFFTRTAGTGDPSAMVPNAAYESIPRARVVPGPPDSGIPTPGFNSPDTFDSIGYGGYTEEDPLW